MIEVEIPGKGEYRIENLVSDFTGTLSVGGVLLPGVAEAIRRLSEKLEIHIVTADTMETARQALSGLPCRLTVLEGRHTAESKLEYLKALGPAGVIAFGNGANDRLLLEGASISVAVLEGEGCAAAALFSADIVVRCVSDAFGLLEHPDRLKATLRD